MKVRVTVTLDIDEDAWMLSYGIAPQDVREDVRDHASQSLIEHYQSLELLKA